MISVAVYKMKTRLGCTLSIWIFCVCQLLLSAGLVGSVPLNIDGPSREVANNSLADFDISLISKGCRYKALFYTNGEEVSTDEPCLACQCKGTVVVCKLRICSEIPVPPPPGCIVVHKAKSCCSQLICHGQENTKKISREQRFPINVSNETLLAAVNETKDAGYCVLDGTVYAEGSAMRSSTLCQYCFCIRGEMKCSSPQCVIPLKGCKPRFRSYACCPTNYDCGQSNETAVLKTLPSSTQVPSFLKGCQVNGQFVPEGEPVLPVQIAAANANSSGPTNVCQTCFCMGGVVHCRPLECDKPIDGCTPIKEDDHCCPDRYDCTKPQNAVSTRAAQIATLSQQTTTTPKQIITEPPSTTSKATEPQPVVGAVTTFDDVDMTTNTNDDSFERVAAITVGSSEEGSAVVHSFHKSRVSATTVGGFKNRSDLGSREERRSKDGDELSRKHSTEDDERDDANFTMFDTTIAIEQLGTTAFDDSIEASTSDAGLESEISAEEETTLRDTPTEVTTENNNLENEPETTLAYLYDHDQPEQDINEENPTTVSVDSSEIISTTPDATTIPPSSTQSEMSPSSSELNTISATTLRSLPDSIPTTTHGSLEFIPFGVEDAVVPDDGMNNTNLLYSNDHELQPKHSHSDQDNLPVPTVPQSFIEGANVSVLKPLELKFVNGTDTFISSGSDESDSIDDVLPILVEKDFHHNPSSPMSSSLYNNGYYPHGSIIKDDGSAEDLIIQEGKLKEDTRPQGTDNLENNGVLPPLHPTGDPTAPRLSTIPAGVVGQTTRLTTKRPELPLKTLSSNDKFIPSYSPSTVEPGTGSYPSRTYSKFGMQDSPMYRIDQHPVNTGFSYTPTPTTFHHRYYNEPEEIPTSRIKNPYNYYSTDNKHRDPGIGMLPQLYKNNQFFYEDSSAALDSYEDYETYIQSTSSAVSTPPSIAPVSYTTPKYVAPAVHGGQFLGERVRLPSYNQQRATSTPKYKYAHFNTNSNNRPSVQSKFGTERPTVSSDHGHRPIAQFPFSLPKTQDNMYNLGIKLSGCNVVGKMYSVGDTIDELSSDCVRCMCSDIGVHCAELKC